jgi:hypothetical protein
MKFIHAKMTFIYGHIHPCMWIKIILNFKFQAHASRSCTSHPQEAIDFELQDLQSRKKGWKKCLPFWLIRADLLGFSLL